MVVYTAIFGNHDDLKEPAFVSPGWKYICFTDQDFKSDVWEVRKVPVMECGPVKTARYYKIMFHKHIESEFSLWIDGTFVITTNLNRWWRKFEAPFTVVNHPYDNCIYKDAESCLALGRGNKRMIERQTAFYKAMGIRKNSGLIASGVLMRQNTIPVREFCQTWWRQVQNWSERDQIAYGFANWKHPNVISKRLDWNYQTEKEFTHIPHIGKALRDEKLRNVYAQLQGE